MNTKIKVSQGTATMKMTRFYFGRNTMKKRLADKAVKDKLKQMLRDMGPFYATVNYYLDQAYSTDMMLLETEADIDGIVFNENNMTDYEEEDVLDNNSRIRMIDLIYVPAGRQRSRGGKGDLNDCLFNCLKQGMDGVEVKTRVLKSPEHFKRWLGLARDAEIDIKYIPLIEKKLQCNITICGSHQYVSPRSYAYDLKIRLWNGHYQYVYQLNEYELLKRGYFERKGVRRYPCFFKKDHEDGTVKIAYLSQICRGIVKTERYPMKWLEEFRNHKHWSKYYFLKEVEKVVRKDSKGNKLWDPETPHRLLYDTPEPEDVLEDKILEYKDFRYQAYMHLDVRQCLDPLKCNGSSRALATHYFYKTAPRVISQCDEYIMNDDLMLREDYWLRQSMVGGLMYGKKKRVKKAYEADVNSQYAYLMKEVDFITRQGRFRKRATLPAKFEKRHLYSIYRVKVTDYNEKLFQPNKKKGHFYTGFDVRTAMTEGYKLELIQDSYPNVLEYRDQCRVPGKLVFGKFVDDIYKLKLAGVKGAKLVLNILWGYLCSYATKTVSTENDEEIADLSLIKNAVPTFIKNGQQHYRIKLFDHYEMMNDATIRKKIFRTKFARFGTFLTALGRELMYKTIKPIEKDVVRVHTDGFISKKPLKGFDVGDKMGQWKLKEGSCDVENACIVKWD